MKNDPASRHRRSIRLKGFDYRRAGAYFATICTQDRACLFGEVLDGEMQVNDAGRMVIAEWCALPERFPTVELDAFIVMPNHVHGVIVIATNDKTDDVGAGLVPAPPPANANHASTTTVPTRTGVPPIGATPVRATPVRATPVRATTRVAPTLGQVVGAFKSWTTVLYARGVNIYEWPPFNRRLWQRNYYEHIVRDEESLRRIRQYIADNPARWAFDRENPLAVAPESEKAWQA